MFDGSIENPLGLAVLMLSALIAFPAAALAVFRSRRPRPDAMPVLSSLTLVYLLLMATLLPFNVLHNQQGEAYEFLFGSERRDTGLAEFLTAFNLVLFALTGLGLWRRLPRRIGLGLLAMSVVALLGAGEEVSWGQWLFGFSSPEFFAENNHQGESNAHNFIASYVFEPVYLVVGAGLIGTGIWLRWGGRDGIATRVPEWAFYALDGRFLAPLALLTGVLFMHEAFEELAECSLSALFLCGLLELDRENRRSAWLSDAGAPASVAVLN